MDCILLNPFVVVDDDDDNIKWASYLYKSQDFNYRFDHLYYKVQNVVGLSIPVPLRSLPV
jgi:hypothetical protein